MVTELAVVVAALALAASHLLAGHLRFVDEIPRSRWLSAAGGVSVAYVFVHVLPDLGEAQRTVGEAATRFSFLERHVYLVALLGLAVFYGLERAAHRSREERRRRGYGEGTSLRVFQVSIASYALYNALIGYLLTDRVEAGPVNLAVFSVAMAVHFVVNDAGLREHHKAAYDRLGRWLLAVAPVAGAALGLVADVSEPALALFFAFLAGAVILNVLKEEVPEERQSRFSAFALGAGAYAFLLLAI